MSREYSSHDSYEVEGRHSLGRSHSSYDKSYSNSNDEEEDVDYDDDDNGDDDAKENDVNNAESDTIALFGAHGLTGHHFVRLALDAGYRVRALVLPGQRSLDHYDCFGDDLLTIVGNLQDPSKVQEVVYGATYVVCMLGETVPHKPEYRQGCLTTFVKLLYPILARQPSVKAFLFQATALAADTRGKRPLFSKVMKRVSRPQRLFVQDQDAVIKYLVSQHQHQKPFNKKGDKPTRKPSRPSSASQNASRISVGSQVKTPKFTFIVTRPSVVLRDGPSTKKLAASKSQPGPFPCNHVDLAEFSLNALKVRKLYNSCPYVVGDGFY